MKQTLISSEGTGGKRKARGLNPAWHLISTWLQCRFAYQLVVVTLIQS